MKDNKETKTLTIEEIAAQNGEAVTEETVAELTGGKGDDEDE